MAENTGSITDRIEVVSYDSRWPIIYQQERDRILSMSGEYFVALEHIGSTAVPGQPAKPIIDMMGAIVNLKESDQLINLLASINYQVVQTGMRNRLFLRKLEGEHRQVFHLHIVEQATWEDRKERMMRDYLLMHPEAREAYGELKRKLATMYAYDSFAYTKAKTEFVQRIIDLVRAARGLSPVDVWED